MPHLDEHSVARLARGDTSLVREEDVSHVASCVECQAAVEVARAVGTSGDDQGTRPIGPPDAGRPSSAEPKPQAPKLARGTVVGRYVVLDVLGEGGMGLVYAGYDPELSRKVALKLLLPSADGEGGMGRARLVREAQAMAQLNDEHVVAVYDVGAYGEQVFVAMELVAGQTLGGWLKETRRSPREVLGVFLQAGQGLVAAHRAGLVHRDFKPENVLLTPDGRAKVTDFGLARATGSLELAAARDAAAAPQPIHTPSQGMLVAQLTQAGTVVGTPAYMPPEQLLGQAPDARGDVFSFSVALYEALYGERPFSGSGVKALKQAIESGEVRPPPKGRAVPAWLRRVVLQGLAATAERRPTMEALLAELGKDPTRTRTRALAAVVTVVLLSAGVAAARASSSGPPPCEPAQLRLQGVWDSDSQQQLEKALLAVPVPYAADTWKKVQASFEAYGAQWVDASDETCRRTKVDKSQSSEVHELRALCLERQRMEWKALVKVFREPTPKVLERALLAVDSLPPSSQCTAEEVVKEPRPALPVDPAERQRVEALAEQLAEAGARSAVKDVASARRLLEPVVTELKKLNYEPLLAEALVLEAHVLGQVQGRPVGLELSGHAVALAFATGQMRLFARALVQAAFQSVQVDVLAPERTQQWFLLADAAIRRSGENPELRVYYFQAAAKAAHFSGTRRQEADALSKQGLDIALAHLPPDSPMRADMVSHRAQVLAPQEDERSHQEALELSRALLDQTEKRYGARHPAMGRRLADGCIIGITVGAADESAVWCGRMLEFVPEPFALQSNEAFFVYALASKHLLTIGRLEEGRKLAEQLDAIRHAQKLADLPKGAWVEGLLAELADREGNPSEALQHAEWVIKAFGKVTDDLDVLRACSVKGAALLRQGHAKEAVRALEGPVTTWEKVGAYAGDRPRARFTLARAMVESRGDLQKARAHAQKAREEYARSTLFVAEVKEIDAWLAQHSK